MSIHLQAGRPDTLWRRLNLEFISEGADQYIDENTGISVQSFFNQFDIDYWDPKESEPQLLKLLHKMGYSMGGTKITQLTNKYVDQEQLAKLKKALKEYREKDRFTLGMTFKNSPARSGGCLTGLQVVKYQGREEAVIYAKIVEVPKKFAADLYFFNGILADLGFHGTVHIFTTCTFFWKVTAPLLVPLVGLERFKYRPFRDHVVRKIKDRAYLASPEYKYRNEARTWEYLKPIIDRMIQEGEINATTLR
jgi:hypothetical protein